MKKGRRPLPMPFKDKIVEKMAPLSRLMCGLSRLNQGLSRLLPARPALSRVSQISCLITEEERGDYEYVKNQRAWIARNMGDALNGTLEVYKNGAFFVLDETQRFGLVHPRDLALCDAALLLCAQLRECVRQGEFSREPDDTVPLTPRAFRQQVGQCRGRYGNGLGRRLRAVSDEALCQELTAYMRDWMLLTERGGMLYLCPAAARWTGSFPAGYHGEIGDETLDEPLEDA